MTDNKDSGGGDWEVVTKTKKKKGSKLKEEENSKSIRHGSTSTNTPAAASINGVLPKSELELANRLSALGISYVNQSLPKCPSTINEFELMNLHPKLLQGIHSYGLEKPDPIQKKSIVPGIQGRDLILQAQSGMGKTVAMSTILLQRLQLNNASNLKCQAVVLAPTRELALQIHEVISKLGQYMNVDSYSGERREGIMCCIGGQGRNACFQQNQRIRRVGTHIIVGTLGRLSELLLITAESESKEPVFDISTIKMFVMDEADSMLMNLKSRPQVEKILGQLSPQTQLILMSATMSDQALKTAKLITKRNPVRFTISNYELTLEGIQQYYCHVGGGDAAKINKLHKLLYGLDSEHTLIFCGTRERVNDVYQKMKERNHAVECIEGTMQQCKREQILEDFRTSKTNVLITSDLLGRGIDIQQVHFVINYDFPSRHEEYIHRVGRCGRHGRKGVAITFVGNGEMIKLEKLESFYNTELEACMEK